MATDPSTAPLDVAAGTPRSEVDGLRLQLAKERARVEHCQRALRDLLAMVHADRGVAACRPGGDDACCRAQRLLKGTEVNHGQGAGLPPGVSVSPVAPAAGEGTGSSGGAAGFQLTDAMLDMVAEKDRRDALMSEVALSWVLKPPIIYEMGAPDPTKRVEHLKPVAVHYGGRPPVMPAGGQVGRRP